MAIVAFTFVLILGIVLGAYYTFVVRPESGERSRLLGRLAKPKGSSQLLKPGELERQVERLSDVKAIQDIRRYISTHANSRSADILARLPETLFREETLALSDLYALDWESFELAIELLRDWRLDRYYAAREDLFYPHGELAFERSSAVPARAVEKSAEQVTAE